MGKLKTPIILLLAALLLSAGAFLPRMAAALQDFDTLGETHFEQVQSVRLTIQEDLPALGKLAMMSKLDGSIEIPDEMASLTRAEVEKIAYESLEPYITSGLADPFKEGTIEIRPILAQVSENPELAGFFWDVVIVGDSEAFYEVNMAIDDETGKVLLINFTSSYVISEYEREVFLAIFAEIYFSALEISDYGDFAVDDLEYQYVGDNALAARYRFDDTLYGEINVDLYIYQNGFYTQFPNL